MSSLRQSVAATLQYAQLFDFDLTLKDLHFRLISPSSTPFPQLKDFLNQNPHLKKKLSKTPSPQRQKRLQISQQKLKTARSYTKILQHLPTIRLVAVTGSIAVQNSQPNDDIDILIVTAPHTLWLTRPLVFLLTKLFFTRRRPNQPASTPNDICNNLWLDTSSLTIPGSKRNLYTAHEIVQLKPLLSRRSTYQKLIAQNSWVKSYLANAFQSLPHHPSQFTSPLWSLLFIFNLFFFIPQYLYMLPKLSNETITLHSAFFHPRSLYPRIKKALHLNP